MRTNKKILTHSQSSVDLHEIAPNIFLEHGRIALDNSLELVAGVDLFEVKEFVFELDLVFGEEVVDMFAL